METSEYKNEIGYNYRMTNVIAAIGVAQLEVLDEYIAIKKATFEKYKIEIKNIDGLDVVDVPDYADNNYWMLALQIDKNKYPLDREGLMKKLKKHNIQTRPIWYPNHLQKPYVDCQSYKIGNTLKLVEQTLNIPCSVNITDNEIELVIEKLS
ncbi:MAG TPA: hypothetical protein ENI76_10625 [Ignavibacteria bacterium]|nr:hypothetical protein [Ignavibacteria bacterium]